MTIRNHRNQSRLGEGFTLIEVIVSIGLITTALGLGAMCFAEVVRLRGAQERYTQRLNAADFLLRRVADDVRSAGAFLPSAGEFSADARTLILSGNDGPVVYHATERGVERVELRPGRAVRALLMDAAGIEARFDIEGNPGAARSVITTAEWNEPAKIGVSRPTLSLRVALRNPARRP